MGKTERVQLGDARATGIKFGVVFGDQHLAVAFEAAGVVEQLFDALPDFHRADRERDLGDVPCKLTDAAGVHPRGMAAGIILLDQHRLHARQAQVKRGRASMDAATDDDGIRELRHPRTTALTSVSVFGIAASSASVIGLTGARSR
jgi:hypothetical protein